MKITLTGPNDKIWTQEVSGDLDLATLKMLAAVDLGLDYGNMIILRNGSPLLNDRLGCAAVRSKSVFRPVELSATVRQMCNYFLRKFYNLFPQAQS